MTLGETGTTTGVADAEVAAAFVVARVAARAGSRFRQGARRPALTERPLGGALELVATTRLLEVREPVARALVAWGEGERRVHLLRRVPRASELLAWQARGERCVSLLADGTVTAPHEDALAFALHDLCHLEKFVDPAHHAGQVGFFHVVHEASQRPVWAAFLSRFDAEFEHELEHVVADMNGSAVFLFAALKMKLKMAVRRRIARELGRDLLTLAVGGPLDDVELAAFDVELETLLSLLDLDEETRVAACRVSTRRDEQAAALAVLGYFEARGSAVLVR